MYDIIYKDRAVGHANVKKEGLYYQFMCTCTPPDEKVYRISVTDGTSRQDLGICVPEGARFTITKRVPCKTFGTDSFSFSLTGKDEPLVSVPVATGARFDYLEQLETAHLQIADGQTEIVIDPVQDLPDSDPNQEYQNR